MCVMGAPIVLACAFAIATGLEVLPGGEVTAATCLDERISSIRSPKSEYSETGRQVYNLRYWAGIKA
jgi:hypothetical protein